MKNNHQLLAPWDTRYRITHALLILTFILAVLYFSFLVLFPSQSFLFDFKNPQASKNTLLEPQSSTGESLEKGNISSDTPLIIDAALVHGDYSTLAITLTPDKKAALPAGTVTIQKAYRAFFLPEGDPINNMDTSVQKIRSGSLLSFADGVFLVDGNLVRPIGDAIIFENLGYTWDDVVPASEEDMGAYEKDKMVILGNLHPDGTVFYDTHSQHYYLIRDQQKHLIRNDAVAQSYLNGTHPILVSDQSLTTQTSCTLTLHGILSKDYACETSIDTLKNLLGDSYRLTTQFNSATSLQSMDILFTDTINTANMRTSLSQIKQRIFSHYGYGQ